MQVQRVAQRIPSLPVTSPVKGVVDLYDVTDDWIPIYDTSDLPGFYMAVGTSGNQFKNAPVAGAMMAELISACEQGRDHDRDPLPFRLAAHRAHDQPRLLLAPAQGQPREQLLGAWVSGWDGTIRQPHGGRRSNATAIGPRLERQKFCRLQTEYEHPARPAALLRRPVHDARAPPGGQGWPFLPTRAQMPCNLGLFDDGARD